MSASTSPNAFQDCQPVHNSRMDSKMTGTLLKRLQTFAIDIITRIDRVREELLLKAISTQGKDKLGKLLIFKYIKDQADSIKTA